MKVRLKADLQRGIVCEACMQRQQLRACVPGCVFTRRQQCAGDALPSNSRTVH